jgi:hypothetical protein
VEKGKEGEGGGVERKASQREEIRRREEWLASVVVRWSRPSRALLLGKTTATRGMSYRFAGDKVGRRSWAGPRKKGEEGRKEWATGEKNKEGQGVGCWVGLREKRGRAQGERESPDRGMGFGKRKDKGRFYYITI